MVYVQASDVKYGGPIYYYENIRRGHRGYEELEEMNMDAVQEENKKLNASSVGILGIGAVNGIALRFNSILEEYKKSNNIFDKYNSLSTAESNKYLRERYNVLEKKVADMERGLDLLPYSTSKKQARVNYLTIKSVGFAPAVRYYAAVFKMACIDILLGDYSGAVKHLESCRSMNSKIDATNLVLGLLCLYNNQPGSAKFYLNEYLSSALDYDEKADKVFTEKTYSTAAEASDALNQEALVQGSFDETDYIENKAYNILLSQICEDSLEKRLSLVITCCMFGGYQEVADTYLAIVEELGYEYDGTLLIFMNKLEEEVMKGLQEIAASNTKAAVK